MNIPIKVGDRMELTQLSSGMNRTLSEKHYTSQLLDYDGGRRAKISVPIYENRIVPLETGDDYQLCFFTKAGLYQCRGRIEKRYKEDNMHVLDVIFLDQLKKYQRRKYYRLDCVMDIKYRMLEKNEMDLLQKYSGDWSARRDLEDGVMEPFEQMEFTWSEGTVSDLSGGGVRFHSREEIQPESIIEIIVHLSFKNQNMPIRFFVRVISCQYIQMEKSFYEIRGEFEYLDEKERELVIQYVFQEQIKRLRKE